MDVTLENNGPIGPVDVGGSINVGIPSDCTVEDYRLYGQGYGSLPLAKGVPQTVGQEFDITCTDAGLHEIMGCAIGKIHTLHVEDSYIYQNFATDEASTEIDGSDAVVPWGRCTVLDPPEICGDGIDNDSDTLVDEEPDIDRDGITDCDDLDDDGFSDVVEAFVGTDPVAACPRVVAVHPAWPPGMNDSQHANMTDVLPLKQVFGSVDGDGRYAPRQDLDANGKINMADVLKLKPYFGRSC